MFSQINDDLNTQKDRTDKHKELLLVSLGAEGVIPSRQIESFLRDFKQFTHNIPSGKIVGFF